MERQILVANDFGSRLEIKTEKSNKEDIMAYSHPNVNAGNRSYDLKNLKETYPHLSALKDSTVNLGDVKVILGQDCYHLHGAFGYKKCGKSKPWAVLRKDAQLTIASTRDCEARH